MAVFIDHEAAKRTLCVSRTQRSHISRLFFAPLDKRTYRMLLLGWRRIYDGDCMEILCYFIFSATSPNVFAVISAGAGMLERIVAAEGAGEAGMCVSAARPGALRQGHK